MHTPSESVAALVLAPPQGMLNPIQKANRFLVRLPLLPLWLFSQLAMEGTMYGEPMTWAVAKTPRQGLFDYDGPTPPSVIVLMLESLVLGVVGLPFAAAWRVYHEAANIRSAAWNGLCRIGRALVGQEPL